MALDIHHVALEVVGATAEKVIEANVIQYRRRSIGGDMTADSRMLAGPQHHGHGVPADIGVQPAFDGQVARVGLLAVDGNGVDVGRGDPTVEIAMAGDIEVQ